MKLSKTAFGILLCTLLISFTSCDSTDAKSLAIGQELEKSYTLDGQQVELTGYIYPHSSTWISNGKARAYFYDTNNMNKNLISSSVIVNFGENPNSINFRSNDKPEDVNLYDKDGKRSKAIETKVKITGTVRYENKDAIDPATNGKDYHYVIENVVIEQL